MLYINDNDMREMNEERSMMHNVIENLTDRISELEEELVCRTRDLETAERFIQRLKEQHHATSTRR